MTELTLLYDRLGARLRAVGKGTVAYDRWGARMRTLGAAEIGYDHLGTRPRTLQVPDDTLDADLLAVVFVLLERQASDAD